MKRYYFIILIFIFSLPALSDGKVVITINESDEHYSARGEGIINAPSDIVWGVLNDYNDHARFMPGAVESRIIETTSSGFIVYKKIKIMLSEIEYTLMVINSPATLISRYELVRGPFKKNEGTWKLKVLPDGKTMLTYDLEIKLESHTPRWLQKIVYEQVFPDFFTAIDKESQQRLKNSR